jgi:hypothetical protein
VPPSMGQAAVFGKAEAAKANGRTGVDAPAKISPAARNFLFISPSSVHSNSQYRDDSSNGGKGALSDHSDRGYFGLSEKGFRAVKSPYTKLPEE